MELLFIDAENYAIRNNYVNARIDKTQENCKYRERWNNQPHDKWMQQTSRRTGITRLGR